MLSCYPQAGQLLHTKVSDSGAALPDTKSHSLTLRTGSSSGRYCIHTPR